VLPFLERLLYRPRDVASIRVLVITPTRELAQQIHTVLERLSQYTDVTSCLICGGKKDVRSQEATLRQRPDVVVSYLMYRGADCGVHRVTSGAGVFIL
jgi:ATP-dependent RNA helicase DDX27